MSGSFSSTGSRLRAFNFLGETAVVTGVVGGGRTPVGGVADCAVSESEESFDKACSYQRWGD
jgi:hypothetical protein